MKALKGLAVALLLAAVPLVGVAQDKRKTLNPWVDCGIGGMIFTEVGWAAVISNVIWDLGTTAVISDYSSQNTCGSKKAQSAAYIGAVYANLSEDIVKGDGKHLRALLDIRGCEAVSHEALISAVRPQFAKSLRDAGYAGQSPAAKGEAMYNLFEANIEAQGAQCRA